MIIASANLTLTSSAPTVVIERLHRWQCFVAAPS
jgi:hypothetical protein